MDNNKPKEEELLSINDIIRNYRLAHPTRNRYVSNIHLMLIASWLVLRWAVIQPVIKYIKELIDEQRNGLSYKSKR